MKKFFSEKYFTYLFSIIFIFTLIPLAYLSFINRASADDYEYGVYTKIAWLSTHSLIEVIKAAAKTVRQYYYDWQGTWFDIFVFTFQPEVFSDKAYVIVAPLMLFLWIGSTFLMFREILFTGIGMDKWSYRLITIIFLIISIQYIPSTRSSIFWFNGCAHYMIPFAICQLLVYSLLRFGKKYSYKWYIIICVLMTLLGGANYQAALFGLIVAFYFGIGDYIQKKNKRILILIFPIILESIGLIISIIAPGNKVRGGAEFGFSVSRGFSTIGLSFVEGIQDIGNYIINRPLVYVGLFFLFLIFLNTFQKENLYIIKHRIIDGLALFCLYSAMQAPAIYANVGVTAGVDNMNYQVFLFMASGILLMFSQYLVMKYKEFLIKYNKKIYITGLAVCMMLLVIGRSHIKTSTLYVSMEYITSGQAADYKEQMDLQTMIMNDKNITDVVLPGINDVQGPLLFFPVTDDPNEWTNIIIKDFYGKNSVIAIPRPEWEELYGNLYL